MKHLVNQVYDQMIDEIDVVSCLSFLFGFGLDPNYVPPNVCSNLMVLFSIAADISIQVRSNDSIIIYNLDSFIFSKYIYSLSAK